MARSRRRIGAKPGRASTDTITLRDRLCEVVSGGRVGAGQAAVQCRASILVFLFLQYILRRTKPQCPGSTVVFMVLLVEDVHLPEPAVLLGTSRRALRMCLQVPAPLATMLQRPSLAFK